MEKILFNEFEIRNNVKQLGEMISTDYKLSDTIVVIGILKGAFMFTSDLVKNISVPSLIDFVEVKSYKGTESNGKPELTKDLTISVQGKDVILVDGIIDTGYTLDFLIKYLRSKGANTVKTAVLLDKKCKRKVPVKVNYCCFEIEDKFVVGYGMDYLQLYRNIPYIKEL